MACRSVSDPAVVVLLLIALLVSFRVVASATRGKDGRGRPERTPRRRAAGKTLPIHAARVGYLRSQRHSPAATDASKRPGRRGRGGGPPATPPSRAGPDSRRCQHSGRTLRG